MNENYILAVNNLLLEPVLGYTSLPIPTPLDQKVTNLIDLWLSLDSRERAEGLLLIDYKLSGMLLAYSVRMASRAVRCQQSEDVFRGLIALGMTDWKSDARNNIRRLSVLMDATMKISPDPASLFVRVRQLLPPDISKQYEDFYNRSPSNRGISVMAYEESVDNDGFIYRNKFSGGPGNLFGKPPSNSPR